MYSDINCIFYQLSDSINKASNAWGIDCLRYEISEYNMECASVKHNGLLQI